MDTEADVKSKKLKSLRRKQKRIRKERRQQRIIYVALGGSVVASVIWLIALCTTSWTELVLPQPGVYLPSLRHDDRGHVVLVEKMWLGFWRQCRVERSNVTDVTDGVTESLDAQKVEFCTHLSFYPPAEDYEARGLDGTLLDYRRAVTGMAIVGMLVAVTANTFTIYAVIRPRYVLRRLAGCLQVGTAACLLVCIEIFEGSLSYARSNLPNVYPPDTLSRVYGYSFGLAWFSFAVFLLAGIVLLFYSRKEKDTDKDQPVILGRL